jgi:hypothetical protein
MLKDLSPESSNLPLVLLLLQLVFSSGSHGAKAFSEDHEDLFESVIDRVLSGLDFLDYKLGEGIDSFGYHLMKGVGVLTDI